MSWNFTSVFLWLENFFSDWCECKLLNGSRWWPWDYSTGTQFKTVSSRSRRSKSFAWVVYMHCRNSNSKPLIMNLISVFDSSFYTTTEIRWIRADPKDKGYNPVHVNFKIYKPDMTITSSDMTGSWKNLMQHKFAEIHHPKKKLGRYLFQVCLEGWKLDRHLEKFTLVHFRPGFMALWLKFREEYP